MSSNSTSQQQSLQIPATINLTFGADSVIMFGILAWALWDKFARPTVAKKLEGVFQPIEEERKLNTILSQIGVISGASKVLLAAFHNGALDNTGYHLQKMSVVNKYIADNELPMSTPMRDIPIGKVMYEIEMLLQNDKTWVCTQDGPELLQSCRDHLQNNHIDTMYNRLVKVGNLPIGIISIQYTRPTHTYHRRKSDSPEELFGCNISPVDSVHVELLEDLYNEICQIMRRRVVHPGPVKKFFMGLFNKY
jgi:hypothetical protein